MLFTVENPAWSKAEVSLFRFLRNQWIIFDFSLKFVCAWNMNYSIMLAVYLDTSL